MSILPILTVTNENIDKPKLLTSPVSNHWETQCFYSLFDVSDEDISSVTNISKTKSAFCMMKHSTSLLMCFTCTKYLRLKARRRWEGQETVSVLETLPVFIVFGACIQ